MSLDSHAVGIGLRAPHYRALDEQRPALGFVEVHSENFFADGGAALRVLERARAAYPVSLHGVGLSLGSADTLATGHLDKLARLAARIEPCLVSEHLCWGAIAGSHLNDLLPLPYTDEALTLMVGRVQRVQERLARPILIENVSAYLDYRASTYSETGFLAELARRSGCQLLLDINNLYVNACNFGAPTRLSDLDGVTIGEIHLAGHTVTEDCLIDDHGSRVSAPVWALYREAIARFGVRPTLIEWDTDIPELAVLLDEASFASSCQAGPEHARAA